MVDTADKPEQNMTLERLTSLYELIGRMNSVYDLQELLEFVVDRALNLTTGRQAILLLREEAQAGLQKVAVARGEELNEQELDHILQFVSTTVIEDVLVQGEPRLVMDLRADSRYEHSTSSDTQQKKVRSVLAVPLRAEQQLIGLLYIDHPREAIFDQSDLDFLSAFATQSALAIKRAREHKRQVEELTLLNELSRSIVQMLDLDEVLTRIAREAIRMLNVETGSVLLLNEATDELLFATSISHGERRDIPIQLQRDQGIAGWVISTGQPACVNNVADDPRWFGEVEPGFVTRSLLCVPLERHGEPLGVLQLLNKKDPAGFNQADIALLSAFAASATIAIENARLFREARRARQLRALNEVAITLSSTLDLATILHRGLEQALDVFGAEAGAIVSAADQTELAPEEISRGLSDRPRLAALLDHILARIGQEELDTVRFIDQAHPLPGLDGDLLARSEVATVILAPLTIKNEIGGALILLSQTPQEYDPDEMNLLDSMARIISLATQNAIYYHQVHSLATRLTYLNEIGSALTSSLDLGHVLEVFIDGVNVLLETERASVFLIDAETNELVLRYTNDGEADIRLPAPWQGIAGWVASHDQPALVNDTLSDPRHLRELADEIDYQANSILCVPLKVEGEVIGVVEVLNKIGGQQFNHRHQALLLDLTNWAAIAIHNARLFDERVQAYQRLTTEQQRRVAAETRAAMAAVILDMAHTMNNVVGAIRVWATNLANTAQNAPSSPLIKFQKEITQIRQNAEEAIKLMSTMTDPLQQAAIAPTDLHLCLTNAIRSCWWPENIQLHKDYGDESVLVKANPKRLETVFHNLLSNAIQALAQTGGDIWLRTERLPDEWIEITIIDNGPGVPAELAESLFNPGVSGKSEGLGIGLWLVETFIHQFEGRIDFISNPDEGTTFTVTLQQLSEGE